MIDLARSTGVPAQGGARPLPLAYDSGVPLPLGRVRGTHLREAQTTDTSEQRARWADHVVASLAPGQLALGSLTFSRGTDVMHRVDAPERSGASSGSGTPRSSAGVTRVHRSVPVPSAADYREQVSRALEHIADGTVQKVVLGRGLDVQSVPALDPHQVLARLLDTRPGRHVFAVPTSRDLLSGPVLVGASPELLVRRRGLEVTSHPLAGSVPRSSDPVEDVSRGEALASSVKDLAEHAFVVDAIVTALRPFCTEVVAEPHPSVMATDTLWHLGTQVTARLDPDLAATLPSALHLAQLLHPTPAVGGVPEAAAVELVDAEEGDLRGPLAGAVGWVDADGDGEFAVAIRAGLLHGSRMRLFAGAGIVAGSVPELEARETGAKLLTMVRALGLPEDVVATEGQVTHTSSDIRSVTRSARTDAEAGQA